MAALSKEAAASLCKTATQSRQLGPIYLFLDTLVVALNVLLDWQTLLALKIVLLFGQLQLSLLGCGQICSLLSCFPCPFQISQQLVLLGPAGFCLALSVTLFSGNNGLERNDKEYENA